MILFELMELDHPYDGNNTALIALKAMEGKVKPLKSKRSPELVALYNSMRDMVLFIHKSVISSLFPFYWIFFKCLLESFCSSSVLRLVEKPSYLQHDHQQ
jgi:hypothetical protein